MTELLFVITFFLGGLIGYVLAAMLFVAARADEWAERRSSVEFWDALEADFARRDRRGGSAG